MRTHDAPGGRTPPAIGAANGSDPGSSDRVGFARRGQVIPLRRDSSYKPANIVRGLIGPTPLNVLNYTSPRGHRRSRSHPAAGRASTPSRSKACTSSPTPSTFARSRRAPGSFSTGTTSSRRSWRAMPRTIATRCAPSTRSARPCCRATSKIELLRLCDAHTVCSEREREVLLSRVPDARIEVVGNGVDCEFFQSLASETRSFRAREGELRDVLFMGRMDYHANIDAALYFVSNDLAADSRAQAGAAAGDRGSAAARGDPVAGI